MVIYITERLPPRSVEAFIKHAFVILYKFHVTELFKKKKKKLTPLFAKAKFFNNNSNTSFSPLPFFLYLLLTLFFLLISFVVRITVAFQTWLAFLLPPTLGQKRGNHFRLGM